MIKGKESGRRLRSRLRNVDLKTEVTLRICTDMCTSPLCDDLRKQRGEGSRTIQEY